MARADSYGFNRNRVPFPEEPFRDPGDEQPPVGWDGTPVDWNDLDPRAKAFYRGDAKVKPPRNETPAAIIAEYKQTGDIDAALADFARAGYSQEAAQTYLGGVRQPATGGGGGGGRARDPLLILQDQLQIDMMRRKAEDYPEDRQMQRDIGYGGLDISRGNLAVNQRQIALQELINAEGSWAQRAADALGRGQLQEAIEARKKANEFSLRRAELEEQDLGLRAELGYAASRQAGERNLMQEAELFGRDRSGQETASERQRGFTNLFAQQQARTQQGDVEADRRQSGLNLQSQIEQRAFERARMGEQDEEQKRRFDVGTMIASRRPAPRTVMSGSRGLWA